ncbi:MAG: hypothetical protein U9R15_09765 [Chloroflexota bacterium]|nr:hypothetical protein [Chloroflexota bacterium]
MIKKEKDLRRCKETVTSIPIEEHIGEEKIDEIVSKEHVAQDLPEKTSTKRRMSPNSLKNLVQYNPKVTKESKKKMLKNLIVSVDEDNMSEEQLEELKGETEIDENLEIFKTLEVKVGGKLILLSSLISGVFPTYQTLNKKEMVIFNNISATYLKDFENEELSYSDMDDVFSLAMNKILELRLLKTNKARPKALIDLFVPLEKLRKQSDKLKEALSNTRKDRKKQTLKTGVSILDLAASFDEERKEKLEEKEKQLLKNEKEFLKTRSPSGNKDDMDAR